MTQVAQYKSTNAPPGSPGMFDVGSSSNSSVKRRVKNEPDRVRVLRICRDQ